MNTPHRHKPGARRGAALLILALTLGAVRPASAEVIDGVTILISSPAQGQANNLSGSAAVSADGQLIAFDSDATNLVANDGNNNVDVFVRDRFTPGVELISRTPAGATANGESVFPEISTDGRYVAFESTATNLVAGDLSAIRDIFVRDRQTGAISIVSKSSLGAQGDGHSFFPSISGDGRYVAFSSIAGNLVANDTNDVEDVFVHDRNTGATVRVSVSSLGVEGDEASWSPAISADGQWVAFSSAATTLVADDDNGKTDVYLHNLSSQQTQRISVATGGAQANDDSEAPAVSTDGRFVVFQSRATNLDGGDSLQIADIFLYDRNGPSVTRITRAYDNTPLDKDCEVPDISADGSRIVFECEATVIIPNDNNGFLDIFMYDTVTAQATLISRASGAEGAQGDLDSFDASISANGQVIAFSSEAFNLVPRDVNGRQDVFIHAFEQYHALFLPLAIKR